MKPFFLISIDTEGDNLWSKPDFITTENSKYLSRFQNLCNKYSLKPTWLTNYEMTVCPVFKEFGKEVLKTNTGEIGMHLHAWNSPPLTPLTENDNFHHPYLIEYNKEIMEDKINFHTDLLEETFETKMVTHRAGRWSFNKFYAELLLKKGYKIDCSVTPLKSWKDVKGMPDGDGGTNFTSFPSTPYFLNINDISKQGNSPMLEIPMTIFRDNSNRAEFLRKLISWNSIGRRVANRIYPDKEWFRPNGFNKSIMKKIMKYIIKDEQPCIQFMLHSSEFMPGGSPNFPDTKSIEKLYNDLEEIFAHAQDKFTGATHKEFYDFFSNRGLFE